MSELTVKFTRKEWTPQTGGLKISPVDNQVWTLDIQPVKNNTTSHWCKSDAHRSRYAAHQAQKLLTNNFSSVVFFSPTSIYFYFTDEADEAYFMIWANSEEKTITV